VDNSVLYPWQTACASAMSETDPERMADRINDALKAIESRLCTYIPIDEQENRAIRAAWRGLTILKSERCPQEESV
jgi:hypothetical protein